MNKLRYMVLLCLSLNAPLVFSERNDVVSGERIVPVYSSDNVLSVDIDYVDDIVHLLLGKKVDGVDSFWYQTSSDQGETWTEAVNITEGHSIQARATRGNDAQLAVQGSHVFVVWGSRKQGAPHSAGPMAAMASDDSGKTWRQVTSPADWLAGSHGFFALDANRDEMSLVWLDSRTKTGDGATQGLRYANSNDGGFSWSANTTLDERSCACCWNTASYFEGDFYVLYRDKDPSDMTLGKMTPEQKWQSLSTVGGFNWDFQGCPHIGGSIAFDRAHDIIHSSVGTGHPDKTGTYYLNSKDGGKTWTEPFSLGGETAVHSDIAASGNGDVLAVWDNITETGFQIAAAQSDHLGQHWAEPIALSARGVSASHPRTIGLKSGFLVLWTEGESKKPSTLRIVKVN